MYLNITTTAGCRGKCVYCPQDRFQKAMRGRPAYLSAAEFAELLPHLRDTHFSAFSFGGFSEPFDDPDIVELFELTQAEGMVDGIWVHTNGEAVTPDLVQRMAAIRFDLFDISCHGFNARVYERTRPFIDSGKVRANVLYLLEHRANIARLIISVTGPFGSPEERAELAALCARHNAILDERQLHSRAGLLKIGHKEQPGSGAFRCGKFDFEKPVLLPGGDLSLCCQDFSLSYIIGNLHQQTFREIMEHSPLRRHVLDVASGATADPGLHCYQCEFCIPCDPVEVPGPEWRTSRSLCSPSA